MIVRVNGEQLLFTYFNVEAVRVDPPPTVVAQRPLWINLAPAKDASHVLIFVDAFKVARAWIPHRPSDDTWDTGETLDLDEHGWVRSLQPDQEAVTLAMLELGAACPGGRSCIRVRGTSTSDGTLASSTASRVA